MLLWRAQRPDSHDMNEYHRMQYLDAMGIDCFVPRYVLPNARQSEPCESSPVTDITSTKSASVEPSLVDEVGHIVEFSGEVVETLPEANVPAAQVSLNEHDIEGAVLEAAEFSLALWRVSPQIQVVDSHHRGSALPTDSLLANMLTATHLLPLDLPTAEYLCWPMMQNQEDTSWSAAQQMVRGFFEGRFIQHPVSYILVFGDAAYNAVIGGKQAFSDCLFSLMPVEEFSSHALVLPDLFELLHKPLLKRRVWLSLRGIQKTLGGC